MIIGSGCAGNTAAIYTARANLSPLVVAGHEPGGQLSITSLVENFPGFPEGIHGPELVENMKKQAEHFGADSCTAPLWKPICRRGPFPTEHRRRMGPRPDGHHRHRCFSERWLNLPNEQRLIGKGVSSCATCDRFYRDKEIMVVGGGDTAMEDKLPHPVGRRVALVHRRDSFRASRIMLDRARSIPRSR